MDRAGAEFFPCVVFYSINGGEKVEITDACRITQSATLGCCGVPHCAPGKAAIAQHIVDVLHSLHDSGHVSWKEVIADHVKHVLGNPLTLPSMGDWKAMSNSTEHNVQYRRQICSLSERVLPVLIVLCNADSGLRVGSHIIHQDSQEEGIILGKYARNRIIDLRTRRSCSTSCAILAPFRP